MIDTTAVPYNLQLILMQWLLQLQYHIYLNTDAVIDTTAVPCLL